MPYIVIVTATNEAAPTRNPYATRAEADAVAATNEDWSVHPTHFADAAIPGRLSVGWYVPPTGAITRQPPQTAAEVLAAHRARAQDACRQIDDWLAAAHAWSKGEVTLCWALQIIFAADLWFDHASMTPARRETLVQMVEGLDNAVAVAATVNDPNAARVWERFFTVLTDNEGNAITETKWRGAMNQGYCPLITAAYQALPATIVDEDWALGPGSTVHALRVTSFPGAATSEAIARATEYEYLNAFSE